MEIEFAPKKVALRHINRLCANATFFGATLRSVAQRSATLPGWKVLWRNVSVRCAVEVYFAPKKVSLRQRTLLCAMVSCLGAKWTNVAPKEPTLRQRRVSWRNATLRCAKERCVGATNLASRQGRLRRRKDPYGASNELAHERDVRTFPAIRPATDCEIAIDPGPGPDYPVAIGV
jgi:hypothetical protein